MSHHEVWELEIEVMTPVLVRRQQEVKVSKNDIKQYEEYRSEILKKGNLNIKMYQSGNSQASQFPDFPFFLYSGNKYLPYLPATAIKGAIRTAVISEVLSNNLEALKAYVKRISKLSDGHRRRIRPSAALELFALCGKINPVPGENLEPLWDPFGALRFETGAAFESIEKIKFKRIYVTENHPKMLRQEKFHALPIRLTSKCRVVLDFALLKRAEGNFKKAMEEKKKNDEEIDILENCGFDYLKDMNRIIEACRNHAERIIEFERDKLLSGKNAEEYGEWKRALNELEKKQKDENSFLLPVGAGCGWMSKTMGVLLYTIGENKDKKRPWEIVKRFVELEPWKRQLLRSRNPNLKGRFHICFPRTKTLAEVRSNFYPPGWILVNVKK